MALTNIADQKTPARPVEITFAAETGLPSANQELLLIGHAASGATGVNTVVVISNVADVDAGQEEAESKFGAGSELANMVVAAIKANNGGSTFPTIKCCVLDSTDASIAANAQTAIKRVKAEYVVSPYDMNSDSTERDILKDMCLTMSGAARVSNNQFGSIGVAANQDESDPSGLFSADTQFLCGVWLPDSDPTYSLGELAAAAAAKMAANGIPFNPVDDVTIVDVPAPADHAEWITVGAGLESEVALGQGWTPLFVKPNGEVGIVRAVTMRLSADGTGSPIVGAYYDVMDFNVLYFWRKTVYTRLSQPDFKRVKASEDVAVNIKAELIRLATQFEAQAMFQAVSQLAKQFKVERSATDRHRFDVFTPVNVIPGLHVIATNVQAGTQFDVVTV